MYIHDSFRFHATVRGEVPMLLHGDEAYCYADVLARAEAFAKALIGEGLGVGDRFCMLSKNRVETLVAFLAGSMTGAVAVALNYRLAPVELAYIINDTDAKLLFVDEEHRAPLSTIADDLTAVKTTVVFGDEGSDGFAAWVNAKGGGDVDPYVQEGRSEADAFYQLYTSGTTGRPKGAELSHKGVIANAIQSMAAAEYRPSPGDHVLLVLPLYHAAGAGYAINAMRDGLTIVMQSDFDPVAFVDALGSGKVVAAVSVPAILQACLAFVPDVAARDYSNLKVISYGASPIAPEVLRKAMQVFKCDFYQGYGQTEASAVITVLTSRDHARALNGQESLLLSAGRPVPGTEIKVVDPDGKALPPGEVGEILARGPQLMNGYWKLPEQTEKTLKGGWLHTGDAGRIDENGFLYVEDRIKDMILSGGENIYPKEIEDVLYAYEGIADAAVIGVPDETWGETVMACIVEAKPGTVDKDALTAFCRERLAGFKIPRRIEIMKELPRNLTGKVLKKDLRAPYWEGHSRQV
ncbi:MAG: long-chain-fatty-acid--CoA ligase [Pseudomonadota bacterium]